MTVKAWKRKQKLMRKLARSTLVAETAARLRGERVWPKVFTGRLPSAPAIQNIPRTWTSAEVHITGRSR